MKERTTEITPFHIRIMERRTHEAGTTEVGTTEVAVREIGIPCCTVTEIDHRCFGVGEVCIVQFRSGERSDGKIGGDVLTGKLTVNQFRHTKIGALEIDTAKDRLGELASNEHRSVCPRIPPSRSHWKGTRQIDTPKVGIVEAHRTECTIDEIGSTEVAVVEMGFGERLIGSRSTTEVAPDDVARLDWFRAKFLSTDGKVLQEAFVCFFGESRTEDTQDIHIQPIV